MKKKKKEETNERKMKLVLGILKILRCGQNGSFQKDCKDLHMKEKRTTQDKTCSSFLMFKHESVD